MKPWSINTKTRFALMLLLVLVAALAWIGFYSVSLFRNVVRDIAWRSQVLPIATELSGSVSEMRTILGELRGIRRAKRPISTFDKSDFGLVDRFQNRLSEFKTALMNYEDALKARSDEADHIPSSRHEGATLAEIQRLLVPIDASVADPRWISDEKTIDGMDEALINLRLLAEKLPGYLHIGLTEYAQSVRSRYTWLSAVVVATTCASALILAVCLGLSYRWIFRPLRILIDGSRLIATGTFQHRITLHTRDEMAELAEALNRMTDRFEEIRDDLDSQVRYRTQEVIRSEQLAGVGFLAAGVAHEINNPLATIAMSAESLQRRLQSLLDDSEEAGVVRKYLNMIQEEAFRCKGITEKLLDLSRAGKKSRERVDLAAVINDLVDMLSQHETYRNKTIRVETPRPVVAEINEQEMKQVLLNLMTNALDFVATGGLVRVVLHQQNGRAVIEVIDNGVGMSAEVLPNIFEPFFTQRQYGRGTGLGLSISHRIVTDHGGTLEAESEGLGKGSTFRITL